MAAALRRNPFRSPYSYTARTLPRRLGLYDIMDESNPDRLAKLVLNEDNLPGARVADHLFKTAIHKLDYARRPDLIERVADHRVAPPSNGFLVRLTALYFADGMPDRAAAALARIPCPPTERALTHLLSIFLHNRKLESLSEAFEKLEEHGIFPEVIHYNVFLLYLCSRGDVATAREVLGEMPSRGATPDITSYNAILDGYLKANDEAGFDEILEEISAKGLEPNVSTYNCRFAALCGKGKSSEAKELLDIMVSRGVLPDRAITHTIVSGFCKEGEVGKALKFYERMLGMKRADGNKAVARNFSTYMVLLQSLVEKGEFGPALDICTLCLTKRCAPRNCAPPFDVVVGLIDGLRKNSQVEEAKDIAKKMKKKVRGYAVDAWKNVESELAL